MPSNHITFTRKMNIPIWSRPNQWYAGLSYLGYSHYSNWLESIDTLKNNLTVYWIVWFLFCYKVNATPAIKNVTLLSQDKKVNVVIKKNKRFIAIEEKKNAAHFLLAFMFVASFLACVDIIFISLEKRFSRFAKIPIQFNWNFNKFNSNS